MVTQTGPLQTSNSLSVITSHVQSSHHCLMAGSLPLHHHYLDQEGDRQQARMVDGVERMASAVEVIGADMEEEEEGEVVDSTTEG